MLVVCVPIRQINPRLTFGCRFPCPKASVAATLAGQASPRRELMGLWASGAATLAFPLARPQNWQKRALPPLWDAGTLNHHVPSISTAPFLGQLGCSFLHVYGLRLLPAPGRAALCGRWSVRGRSSSSDAVLLWIRVPATHQSRVLPRARSDLGVTLSMPKGRGHMPTVIARPACPRRALEPPPTTTPRTPCKRVERSGRLFEFTAPCTPLLRHGPKWTAPAAPATEK